MRSRRSFLSQAGVFLMSTHVPSFLRAKEPSEGFLIEKNVPSSGIQIPSIGMGTWITFNVGSGTKLRNARAQVLNEFFKAGGTLIDSSPMYGSSQEVIGYGLRKLNKPKNLFAADKIWTSSKDEGPNQFQNMQIDWGIKSFGVLQVHNLVNWQDHLPFLFKLKKEGKIKHVGVTTSHGRRHNELKEIMKSHPLDFVQLTYNITHRDVEKDILPLAQDKKIAVIANRPLDGGLLFEKVKGRTLPKWAKSFDCNCWSQFFLKFITSHPAITCAIPATSQVPHMIENMGACRGRLPDEKMRRQMISHINSL